MSHDANAQNAIDMDNARKVSSLNIEPLKHYLHNGRQQWQGREKVLKILMDDPVFDKSQRDFMSRKDRYTRGQRITNRVFELEALHGWSRVETFLAITILDEQLPITLHTVAFEPVFMSQAGSALISKYGALIANRGLIGCYLQTELGHGSNVASLETTATYISKTREFEIHSPTLTSSKWWIGQLGKTATHGVVQAKLILDGKDMGPHLFFVQLRDEQHRLLPGIVAGDIGPKALGGFAATDNGFARFDRVRIPKENMFSKFSQVSDDGAYTTPPHSKISYGGMLFIRSGMVMSLGWSIARAATISIRYATVRRQGARGSDGLERQVITYPSTYYRLIPILSRAYVFVNLGPTLMASFEKMSQRLATGDATLLAEQHAITSGLKVLCSTTAIADIEAARRSMGGHGYSAFSGLGKVYADNLPSATYEGENFVLDQQVVRGALKAFNLVVVKRGTSASDLPPSSAYLRLLLLPQQEPPQLTAASWTHSQTLITLLEWRAALLVHEIAQTVEDPDASIGQRVSKAVTEAFVAAKVGEMLSNLQRTQMGANEKQAVGKVFLLYLQTTIEAALTDFLSFGILRFPGTGAQTRSGPRDPTRELRLAIASSCQEILPNAIGLTDAFGFSDWELDSALGRYDGKAYQALWDKAQTEPLNQTEVADAFEESIKPILQRGRERAQKTSAKL